MQYHRKLTRRATLFLLGASLAIFTGLGSCGTDSKNAADKSATPGASPAASSSPSDPSTAGKKEIRIVRSKQLTALAVLEKQGTLEKALQPLGYTVKWAEFAAGPQQLEALNANGLDIASTAAHPPVFYQAAGNDLVYLATTPVVGKPVALLVPKNSTAKTIADLKGKKVAFQKASIGHYLLYRELDKNGLKLEDVQAISLPPPDANTAFTQGKIDGWYIWDPFITRAEQSGAGRVLVDGEKTADTRNFYTTTRKFYQENPEAIKVFFAELEKSEGWLKDHPKESAQLLASVTQLDPAVLEQMHKKYKYGLRPIDESVIKKQEDVAELWFKLKLIPNKPDVRKGFLTPEQYAKFIPAEVVARKD